MEVVENIAVGQHECNGPRPFVELFTQVDARLLGGFQDLVPKRRGHRGIAAGYARNGRWTDLGEPGNALVRGFDLFHSERLVKHAEIRVARIISRTRAGSRRSWHTNLARVGHQNFIPEWNECVMSAAPLWSLT